MKNNKFTSIQTYINKDDLMYLEKFKINKKYALQKGLNIFKNIDNIDINKMGAFCFDNISKNQFKKIYIRVDKETKEQINEIKKNIKINIGFFCSYAIHNQLKEIKISQ